MADVTARDSAIFRFIATDRDTTVLNNGIAEIVN